MTVKKIGPEITMAGQMTPRVHGHKLNLFDGSYKTGYRILEFRIFPITPTNENEIFAKAHTSKTTQAGISGIDCSDSQELAWVWWRLNTDDFGAGLVKADNMIIEDLYLSNFTSTGDTDAKVNYYLRLQKYSFPSWHGAGVLVENLAQGGPQ